MPYDLSKRLVLGISSSALFDLAESDRIFREQGTDAYRQYQRDNQGVPLSPGVAFSFIKRILSLDAIGDSETGTEVILLSRNDPDTGLRVMKSIQHHGLDITRAVFLRGRAPYRYIPAFNVCLFLSANEGDVREAVMNGYPAGQVLGSAIEDLSEDNELRVAFDFDGVIADDEAEAVYAQSGNNVDIFQAVETERASEPHNPGPLKDLLEKIAYLQKEEEAKAEKDSGYSPRIRIAIITARNAPAHERVVTTLREWGITVDETFFLGGIQKKGVLEIFKPHIFFDDQRLHLDPAVDIVPSVHVPFGIRNSYGSG